MRKSADEIDGAVNGKSISDFRAALKSEMRE
jgi:hypothetical protein